MSALSNQGFVFSLPVGQLVIFLVLSGIAGFAAGAWPAYRASERPVLLSIVGE